MSVLSTSYIFKSRLITLVLMHLRGIIDYFYFGLTVLF